MKAITFANLVTVIIAEMRLADLVRFLAPYMEGPPNKKLEARSTFQNLVFVSRAGLENLPTRVPATEALLEAFGLRNLFSDATLTHVLGRYSAGGNNQNLKGDERFVAFYHATRAFVEVGTTTVQKIRDDRLGGVPPEVRLDVILDDYGEGNVPVHRLQDALGRLESLYANVARALGHDASALEILALDSGTQLQISVVGLADVLREIRQMFAAAFNQLAYWNLNRRDRAMESARIRLEMLDALTERVQSGAIPEEQANKLQHLIIKDIESLLGLGMAPEDVLPETASTPAELLRVARDMKLLGPPATEES